MQANFSITPDQKGFRFAFFTNEKLWYKFSYVAICQGGNIKYGTQSGQVPPSGMWSTISVTHPVIFIGINAINFAVNMEQLETFEQKQQEDIDSNSALEITNDFDQLNKISFNPYTVYPSGDFHSNLPEKVSFNPYSNMVAEFSPYNSQADAFNPYGPGSLGNFNPYGQQLKDLSYDPYVFSKIALNPYELGSLDNFNPYGLQMDNLGLDPYLSSIAFNPYELGSLDNFNPYALQQDNLGYDPHVSSKIAFNPYDFVIPSSRLEKELASYNPYDFGISDNGLDQVDELAYFNPYQTKSNI